MSSERANYAWVLHPPVSGQDRSREAPYVFNEGAGETEEGIYPRLGWGEAVTRTGGSYGGSRGFS